MKKLNLFSVLLLGLLLVLVAVPCPADEPSASPWTFSLVPYFWMAGIDGDMGVGRLRSTVGAEFGDILKHLDFGAMMYLEARKDRFGFYLNPLYMSLSADGQAGPVEAEIEYSLLILESGAMYRAVDRALGRGQTLDIYVGGRYWHQKSKITLSIPMANLAREREKTRDWLDPIIGLRFMAPLTDRLTFHARGDIGGFGLSDNMSDITWNLEAELTYGVLPRMSLWAGYRALYVNYDHGSGRDRYELKATLHGPILGLSFHF